MYPAFQMPSDFMSLFSLHWTARQQSFGHLAALSRGVTITQVHSNTCLTGMCPPGCCLSFCTSQQQQVMNVILTPSFQYLCYFLGQERLSCCELHWTIEQVNGARQHPDREDWDPGCASESRSQVVKGTTRGHCGDPLCGDLSLSLFYTCKKV